MGVVNRKPSMADPFKKLDARIRRMEQQPFEVPIVDDVPDPVREGMMWIFEEDLYVMLGGTIRKVTVT